ncbi:MAG: hypothetical protein ACC656_02640, partial [Candidatus Heimdallarchaeota archaeon]
THKKANVVQAEFDQGEFFALEMQRTFNGIDQFLPSKFNLQPKTLLKVQQNVEPIANIYNLLVKVNDNSYRHSCPDCKNNDSVVLNGRNQRICLKFHDSVKSKHGFYYYSSPTSSEGQKMIMLLANLVSQLLFGNTTHEFVHEILGVSRYFVEFVSSYLAQILPSKSITDLELNEGYNGSKDLCVIFSDFSGSRLSKKIALLVAQINGKLVWYVYQSPNNVVAQTLAKDLAGALKNNNFDGQVVFITDGEYGWLDPLRTTFPDLIHIRQFHKKSILGFVFVHFMHDNIEHTLKCRWDLVKEVKDPVITKMESLVVKDQADKQTSNKDRITFGQIYLERVDQVSSSVHSQRHYRKIRNEKQKDDIKELSKTNANIKDSQEDKPDPYEITLYQARIKTTRGPRKSSSIKGQRSVKTTADGIEDIPRPKVEVMTPSRQYQVITSNNTSTGIRVGVDSDPVLKKRGCKSHASKILFKGNIRDALIQFPWLKEIYLVILTIFGGIHITSNRAENPFKVKHRFAHHGSMKAGYRHLMMQLGFTQFACLNNFQDWLQSNLEKNSFLFHQIVRDKSAIRLNGSRKELHRHLVSDQMLVIDYQNKAGERSIRVVKIHGNIKDNGVFTAFCYRRLEIRSFQFDRILQFCILEEAFDYLKREGRLDHFEKEEIMD